VLGLQVFVVHTQNDGRVDFVLGGNGQQNFFGPCFEVFADGGAVTENACGFHNKINTQLFPGQGAGIALGGHFHIPLVGDKGVSFNNGLAVEMTHDRIVTQQVGQRFVIGNVVDAHNFHTRALVQQTKHRASDPSKTINCDLHG